ncbi:MAG: hypothetical protein ACXV3F_17175 [Frankiaceae bacterium]
MDSTTLDDTVATQDTVTQLIAAVRRVRHQAPGAADAEVVAEHYAAHDYNDPDLRRWRADLADRLAPGVELRVGRLPGGDAVVAVLVLVGRRRALGGRVPRSAANRVAEPCWPDPRASRSTIPAVCREIARVASSCCAVDKIVYIMGVVDRRDGTDRSHRTELAVQCGVSQTVQLARPSNGGFLPELVCLLDEGHPS